MIYPFIRPILFSLDAEFSHNVTFSILKSFQRSPFLSQPKNTGKGVSCFGLHFPNALGLAAGLDKNADCVPYFQSLGFGFIEVGTVTPLPQIGNPKPRLFRYPKEEALINRMGFNNEGVDYLVEKLKDLKRICPIGVNIGKNKDTPLELAGQDYSICFEKVYPFADYVTVNLSSPNTPGLRELQQKEYLRKILMPLQEARKIFADKTGKKVPILVKISPDVSSMQLNEIVDELINLKIEGVIATNTALMRPPGLSEVNQEGGLSGAPLTNLSTNIVRKIYQRAGNVLPIIAVGGIMNANDAKEKLEAGAKLVQIYTGLIYRGPRIINEIIGSDVRIAGE